jgi:hypothetical protein
MWFLTIGQTGLLLFSFTLNFVFARPIAQKYAPVVGRWQIELNIEAIHQSLEFETDGTGVYGLGTGHFLVLPVDARYLQYPAAWSNIDPQRISITGEITLRGGGKPNRGTLLLRRTVDPGKEGKREALFIDEALKIHRGSFNMKMILGPAELLEKKK